jgi:hypothetical protein
MDIQIESTESAMAVRIMRWPDGSRKSPRDQSVISADMDPKVSGTSQPPYGNAHGVGHSITSVVVLVLVLDDGVRLGVGIAHLDIAHHGYGAGTSFVRARHDPYPRP